MQDIAEVIELAYRIRSEKNVTDVAIVTYRRFTFRQLAKLDWLNDDKELLTNLLEVSRVAGILAVEKDGVSFECLNNTTEKKARAIIKGLMTRIDLREIRRAVLR
jgi:hypothetical protein